MGHHFRSVFQSKRERDTEENKRTKNGQKPDFGTQKQKFRTSLIAPTWKSSETTAAGSVDIEDGRRLVGGSSTAATWEMDRIPESHLLTSTQLRISPLSDESSLGMRSLDGSHLEVTLEKHSPLNDVSGFGAASAASVVHGAA